MATFIVQGEGLGYTVGDTRGTLADAQTLAAQYIATDPKVNVVKITMPDGTSSILQGGRGRPIPGWAL